MNNWVFNSEPNSYSLCLPDNWAEYEDEPNVSAFFNTENWSGNLRITYFCWEDEKFNANKASEYLQLQLKKNANATLIRVGTRDAVFYSEQIDDESLVYYWITGEKSHLFLSSFTFDKSELETEFLSNELQIVKSILESIEII